MKLFPGILALIFSFALSAQAHAQIATCNNPPASPSSTTPVDIFLKNTSSETAYVFWVDYNRRPQTRGTLAPGEEISIHSYVGHVFFMATFEGVCLGVYYAN